MTYFVSVGVLDLHSANQWMHVVVLCIKVLMAAHRA